MKINIIIMIISLILCGCESDPIYSYSSYMYNDINDNNDYNDNCIYNIYMESYLEVDNNGFYHLKILNDWEQTFTTLSSHTNSTETIQKLQFISNKEIYFDGYGWINPINSFSYTDENGTAGGVLGVWPQFRGDTIKVYSGFQDECGFNHIDSLEIVIDLDYKIID